MITIANNCKIPLLASQSNKQKRGIRNPPGKLKGDTLTMFTISRQLCVFLKKLFRLLTKEMKEI